MAGDVLLRLFVPGRARTKGHMTPGHTRGQGGRPCKVWLKDRDETKAWMKVLIAAMHPTSPRPDFYAPYEGPVELHTFFRFERRCSDVQLKAPPNDRKVWPSHDTDWPTADDIGDEDTLRRAIGDALTQARVIQDDDLVIGGSNYKRWCLPGEKPGVEILLRTPRGVHQLSKLEEMYLSE